MKVSMKMIIFLILALAGMTDGFGVRGKGTRRSRDQRRRALERVTEDSADTYKCYPTPWDFNTCESDLPNLDVPTEQKEKGDETILLAVIFSVMGFCAWMFRLLTVPCPAV